MKIKIVEKTEGCLPEIIKVGDWIDLITAEETTLKGPQAKFGKKKTLEGEETNAGKGRDVNFNYTLISLGVAMQLPEGFEAVIVPRSSTFKKWGLMQTNHLGVIDRSYMGNDDIWRMPVIATRNTVIPKGTPICQFRIQLSQKATMWQKLKWLFSSKIELVKVNCLCSTNRGGFGTGSDKYRTK